MTTARQILNDGLARAVVYLIWTAAFFGGVYVQQLTATVSTPAEAIEIYLQINHLTQRTEGNSMAERTTYDVTATWDGKWWAIGISNLPPQCVGVTQAATEDEIEPTTRECIGLLLEVPEDSFHLDITLIDKEI